MKSPKKVKEIPTTSPTAVGQASTMVSQNSAITSPGAVAEKDEAVGHRKKSNGGRDNMDKHCSIEKIQATAAPPHLEETITSIPKTTKKAKKSNSVSRDKKNATKASKTKSASSTGSINKGSKSKALQISPPSPLDEPSVPGAVPMAGVEKDVEDEVVSHQDTASTFVDTLVVAELAPVSFQEQEAAAAQMANKIADLEAQLRVQQQGEPVVQAIPMDGPEERRNHLVKNHDVALPRNQRRWFWTAAIALIVLGATIAVIMVVTGKNGTGDNISGNPNNDLGIVTSDPTLAPTTHVTTMAPNSQGSTTSPSSETSTPDHRSILIQTLGPIVLSLDTSAHPSLIVGNLNAWDELLLANPDSPQAQAIEWMSDVDDYIWSSSETLDTEELLERYALCVLLFSTSGTLMNSQRSVCEWENGIKCQDTAFPGLISFLELSSTNSFSDGALPSEIAFFSHLVYLELDYDRLQGTIPTELSSLTQLTYLSLMGNSLSGALEDLRFPESLEKVYLDDNVLSGTLPSVWASSMLPNTLEITLRDNAVEGSIPLAWGSFSQLTSLDLQGNSISGSIPTTFGWLTGLKYLFLSENLLTGRLPTELGSLVELRSLVAAFNSELGGSIPSDWNNLSQLGYLSLRSNAHTGSLPTILGFMTSMVTLYLGGNQLSGPIPSEVGNLGLINNLELYGNELTGSLPKEIGSLASLKYLSVYNNLALTGSVPTEFAQLSNLESFNLFNTSLTGSLDALFCIGSGEDHPSLSADCLGESPEIECSCCYKCCSMEECKYDWQK